jgi:flagellar biogenesis protein FliO
MSGEMLVRTILILLGFFAILLAAAYWIRRWAWGGAAATTQLHILARIPLPPKALLYALRVGEKVLLLGVTEHAVNLLQEYTLEEWEATGMGKAPRLATRSPLVGAGEGLRGFLRRKSPPAL